MSLDLGKLLRNTSELGTTHLRVQRAARREAEPETPAMTRHEYWERHDRPATQACSYCGAPGQRIGSRCEYCQVAVSR